MGKGLSKDEKAQKLALQHWLEAVRLNKHFIFFKDYGVGLVIFRVCLVRRKYLQLCED